AAAGTAISESGVRCLQFRTRYREHEIASEGAFELIEVRDLVKHHGDLCVLNGVSLSVRRGEVAAVIGPSGGGKSTLLRCINGLETFQQGEVSVEALRLAPGDSHATTTLRQLRRRV